MSSLHYFDTLRHVMPLLYQFMLHYFVLLVFVSFFTYTMAKSCTICSTPRPVLVRCQIDDTQTWHFVCPGACWKSVSGGVEDAKGLKEQFPWYRYGGMVRAFFYILGKGDNYDLLDETRLTFFD